ALPVRSISRALAARRPTHAAVPLPSNSLNLPLRSVALALAFAASAGAQSYTWTTIAGLATPRGGIDGAGSNARFNTPCAVAVDAAGNVYVADTAGYTIRKITAAGVVTTLAGLAGVTGSADGQGSAARFGQVFSLAVDAGGDLFVADYDNHTIRRITPA